MAGTFVRIINGALRTIQIDQEVALTSGTTSMAITFPVSLQTANASPRVVAWMFDSTDTNPQFIPVTITARSATGFSCAWNDPLPTNAYILGYMVSDGWVA